MIRATFNHLEHDAGVYTFWFHPEKPVRYSAGQFTELYLPHDADKRGERRWFTLSSSPTESLLAISTKQTAERGSTFKQKLFALQPGDTVTLAEPMGDFVLPKDAGIPLLFVAAGIGITPMRSMIKYLLDTNQQRTIQLIYAAHKPDAFAFQQELAHYNLSIIQVVTSQTGQLTATRILALAQPFDPRTLIYLSGPEHMVEVFTKDLLRSGVPQYRIVTDYFHGYQ